MERYVTEQVEMQNGTVWRTTKQRLSYKMMQTGVFTGQ